MTAREAAERGIGARPKMGVGRSALSPFGLKDPTCKWANRAIASLWGRAWCLEEDCVSFDGGVLILDKEAKVFRVVDWHGVRYRGATMPGVAVKAYEKGMKL